MVELGDSDQLERCEFIDGCARTPSIGMRLQRVRRPVSRVGACESASGHVSWIVAPETLDGLVAAANIVPKPSFEAIRIGAVTARQRGCVNKRRPRVRLARDFLNTRPAGIRLIRLAEPLIIFAVREKREHVSTRRAQLYKVCHAFRDAFTKEVCNEAPTWVTYIRRLPAGGGGRPGGEERRPPSFRRLIGN